MRKFSKYRRLVYERDVSYYVMEVAKSVGFIIWIGCIPAYPLPLSIISWIALTVYIVAFLCKIVKVMRGNNMSGSNRQNDPLKL